MGRRLVTDVTDTPLITVTRARAIRLKWEHPSHASLARRAILFRAIGGAGKHTSATNIVCPPVRPRARE